VLKNTAIAEHLSCAKHDIAAGDKSLRSAADHIAAAIELGASQRDVATTVGKSAAWVNRLLLWRTSGFLANGPFVDDNKKKKQRAAFSQTKQKKSQAFSQTKRLDPEKVRAETAKAEAAKARAEQARAKHAAAEARANARAEREKCKARMWEIFFEDQQKAAINSSDRDTMVKALGMLGSEHDGEILNAARTVERLRHKLNVSWDQLIIRAAEIKRKDAA
jgi:hypothetical protein